MSILKHKTVVVIDQASTGYAARRHRESCRVSLRKTAKEMGVSASFLSDLENGKRNWTQTRVDQFKAAVERAKKGSTNE